MSRDFSGTLLELIDDELRRVLLANAKEERVAAGASLQAVAMVPTQLTLLLSGSAEVVGADERRRLVRGPAEFGLIELLSQRASDEDVRASEPSDVLRIPGADVAAALRQAPDLRPYLRKRMESEPLRRFERTLRQFGVSPDAIWRVIGQTGRQERLPGEVVAAEGRPIAAAYIIEAGRLSGWKNLNGHDVLVSEIGPGDLVGLEQAFNGQPLPTSYRVGGENVTLLTLAPELLRQLSAEDASFRAFLEAQSLASAASIAANDVPEPSESAEDNDTPLEQFLIDESPPPRRPKVKVLRQYDQMDCGSACLAMVAQAYGRKLSVSSYRAIVHVTREGATMWSLLKSARRTGFNALGVALDAEALEGLHLPAVLLMEYHFVVLYRISRKYVWLGDPSHPRLRKVPRERFLKQWSGMALLLRPTDALYQVPETRGAWGKYLKILKRSGRTLFEVFAATLLLSGFGLAAPIFTQIIFDRVFANRDPSVVTVLLLGMAAVAVFQLGLSASRTLLFGHLATKLDLMFSSQFYRHVLRLPLRYFMARRVGDVISRLSELVAIREFLTGNVVTLIINSLSVFIYFAVVALYSHKLAVVLAVTIPAITLVTRLTSRKLRDRHQEMFAAHARLNGIVAEQFTALETVKSLNAEIPARWRWEMNLREALSARLSVEEWTVVIHSINTFLERAAITTVLYFAARLVLSGEISIGQALAASQLASATLEPIQALSDQWSKLQRVAVSFGRVEDTVTTSPEAGLTVDSSRSPRREAQGSIRGRIEFDDVWFQYGPDDSPWVLRGLKLTIEAGQTVALVGRSGSGKTTLAQMVNLLYQPTRGTIRIDGQDASTLPLDLLRRSVGIVMQDNQLFTGSIYENITYGDAQPSMEKAIEAATVANASEFITQQKEGYRTVLGENGSGLSGGQRQRINIARALYRRPPILVLDEATSSLDAESERAVVDGMKRFCKGRTSIIIAHRLSTVLHADKIVLLDGGRVVEQGTHAELIRKGGAYARLFGAQLAV